MSDKGAALWEKRRGCSNHSEITFSSAMAVLLSQSILFGMPMLHKMISLSVTCRTGNAECVSLAVRVTRPAAVTASKCAVTS